MAAPDLLARICAAVLLQLVVAIGIALWRRRGAAAGQQVTVGLERAKSPAPTASKAKLLQREVLPFVLVFSALVATSLLIDAFLHVLNAAWVGRYLGIPGTLLILGSFGYSLRKRKVIRSGNPVRLLHLHEWMAWLGSLLVLVHAGIHFNAILGWLAVWAMLINVGSGLTGKFLLERSRRRLNDARRQMQRQGASIEELEDRMYWDSLTFDVVKQWRVIHFPIALAFAVLATAHIIAIFLFWGWK